MIERDYIMRMVQQLAAALARLFKFKEQKEYGQAQLEIEKSYVELFGMQAQMVALFDSATLAQLLGHCEKVKALAMLFFEQAELHRLNDEPEKAQRQYQRALEMFIETVLCSGGEEGECRERIQALLKIVEAQPLSERYVDALRRHQLKV